MRQSFFLGFFLTYNTYIPQLAFISREITWKPQYMYKVLFDNIQQLKYPATVMRYSKVNTTVP